MILKKYGNSLKTIHYTIYQCSCVFNESILEGAVGKAILSTVYSE